MVTALRGRAAAAGALIDMTVGDPPTWAHPVGWFGTAMTTYERSGYRDTRTAGTFHAAFGVAVAAAAGHAVRSTAAATAVSVAGRGLAAAATAVRERLEADDIDGARALLPTLVGRDPSLLDAAGIARAAVESVAENTVDAVIAPMFWATIAGAPGVLAHRAINTMDAMVGHRNVRYAHYGWASARLDDAAAWVPARLTAALVALVRPSSAAAVRAAVRDQAPAHPSPNSGVAEAAFAAALGITLGGTTSYPDRTERRPLLGHGPRPVAPDIGRAIRLSRHVTLAAAAALALTGTSRSDSS